MSAFRSRAELNAAIDALPPPHPATDPTAAQPATPAEARKRLADAKRHLFAHIIASAHLLDTPFTNAPDQSPWTRMKHAMEGLNAALAELDAAPAAPTTYELPAEPPPEVTELWGHGTANWFERMPDGWRAKADEHGEYSTISWLDVLVTQRRLSSVPPADYNPPTVHGCDDCSVEPGETHRWPGCPGAKRARERLSTVPPAGTEGDR